MAAEAAAYPNEDRSMRPISMATLRLAWPILAIGSFLLGPSPTRVEAAAALAQSPARFERVQARTLYLHPDDLRFRVAEAGFRFRGGTSITSSNAVIYRIRAFNGVFSSGELEDGRAIVLWPSFAQPNEVRIAATAELAGQDSGMWPGRTGPASHPSIAGYTYVAATPLSGTDGEFLGLWRHDRGRPQSLVVSFQSGSRVAPHAPRIIGRLPQTMATIYMGMPSFDGGSWSIHMTSQARVGEPIYILNYEWMPVFFRPLATAAR